MTAVATNAVVFSSRKKVKEFKKAGLHFAQISLDGLKPETHDHFRGMLGAFEKTVRGIKNCIAEGLFVEIATIAARHNIKEVPAMIDFAAKLGVNWFMLYNFVPTGQGAEIIDSDLAPEEREGVLKICWNKMKATGIDVLSIAPQFARIAQEIESNPTLTGDAAVIASGVCEEGGAPIVPTHFSNTKSPGKLKRLADFIGGDGAGQFYLSLEPNGDMFPRVFFPHEDAVRIGNLFKDDFEKVWRRSELFWKIRDKEKLAQHCGDC